MKEGSTGAKIFSWPAPVMLAAIHDLAELQNGDVTFTDKQRGKIHFAVRMHGFVWEYRFTVKDMGQRQSLVTLEVGGRDARDPALKVTRQLALLGSILPGLSGPGSER